MDTQISEFTQLIDRALKLSEKMCVENPSEHLNNLINALQTIKSQTITGQLEPSQGTSTLGLAREVADWVDSIDDPLLKAVGEIEHYYQTYWNR